MRARKKQAIGQRWKAAIILVMHRPSVLGEQAVLHAQRLSDQVSDNRHGRRRTPADIHGRSVPGQACCDAGSPGRYLAPDEEASGSAPAAHQPQSAPGPWMSADAIRCRILPYWIKAAPLRGATGAPAAGLCAGAPARHGRADAGQQTQINPAHSRHRRCGTSSRLPRCPRSQAPRPAPLHQTGDPPPPPPPPARSRPSVLDCPQVWTRTRTTATMTGKAAFPATVP